MRFYIELIINQILLGSEQNKKDLEHKKTGSFRNKSKKSGLVPEVGQISNFLKDDIKLILELEKRDIKLT